LNEISPERRIWNDSFLQLTGVTMNRILFVSSLTLALAVSETGFAQSTTGAANPSPPVAAKPQKAEQSALTIDKLTQDLQKAGFSEVKILQDAFLVQAKTKDGNPILMTISPNGVSALEVSNVSRATPDRTVQDRPDSNSAAVKPAQP
jgi:hypothetical protein